MARSEPIPFAVGDVLRLKKPHPCKSYDWAVVRLGADIGLKCQGCGRRVLLPRREVERRLKLFLHRENDEALPGAGSERAGRLDTGDEESS
jgi:hypothetical protein